MKLKELTIEQISSWRPNAGKYEARIRYEGETGEVRLQLDPSVSEALLAFIGPVITTFSHQAALKLEGDIRQSVLEAQKAPAIPVETAATQQS